MQGNADTAAQNYRRPANPVAMARWDAGYESLTKMLHGENQWNKPFSLVLATSCLEGRLATTDNRDAFNRGGNAAARDYVEALKMNGKETR